MFKFLNTITVTGTVEHGDQRGRELGFPTANLPATFEQVPKDGVWAGTVRIADDPTRSDIVWAAAVSVGRRPTFYGREGVRLLEAHLLDFDGDLYGRRIEVQLQKHLRPMKSFDGITDLIEQLNRDIDDTHSWAASTLDGVRLPQLAGTAGTPRSHER